MQLDLRADKTWADKPISFHRHTHDTYEIYGFVCGDARYFVEGTIYDLSAGDILLIKKAEAHALLINGDAPYSRYVVNFNAAAPLGDNAPALITQIDEKPLGKLNRIPAASTAQKNTWLYYLEQIVNAVSLDEKRIYLTVLLNELCQNLHKTNYDRSTDTENDRIIAYINEHLMEIATLDEICQQFYISKTHLNRKFKTMTGSTVWDYILAKRLIVAKDLLMKGCRPTVVSETCGYGEYSAFYRAYKLKFGVSPKADYQKQE